MTELTSYEEASLRKLGDSEWRRLGVTQTFERLLVEATASQPGSPDDVAAFAGRTLTGGGAKFWELSRANLQADLCRKRILIVKSGTLTLHDEFAARLDKLLVDVEAGVSRVEPTPGVTLESIMEQTAERERRQQKPKAKTTKSTRAQSSGGAPTPKKRTSSEEGASTTQVRELHQPAAHQPDLPVKKVFTSIRVNRMLDHLDNNSLSTTQLGDRLDLKGTSLERFLKISGELELIRVSRDKLVELHWKGREVARTTSADRRMKVLDLVDELRDAAEKQT